LHQWPLPGLLREEMQARGVAMRIRCGFRKDFRFWYDSIYYDGNWRTINLGWFWITLWW